MAPTGFEHWSYGVKFIARCHWASKGFSFDVKVYFI
jgi:spore cortex formation protein SpoVR/YcgB (stage V sporulation)